MTMQPYQNISHRRCSLQTPGKQISSINLQTSTPLIQKTKTVPQEMMEDFLTRQKEYDKIYKSNTPIYNTKFIQLEAVPDKYHHFKDAVKQAKLRFLQFHPNSMNLKKNNRKQQDYEDLTETVRMRPSIKSSRQTKSPNQGKQIEISFIVIIIIPIIFALTLLFELLR